ncbi:hypothetical protein ABZU76_12705 [Amycolatopsis sp. NPDC005232]
MSSPTTPTKGEPKALKAAGAVAKAVDDRYHVSKGLRHRMNKV